MNYFQLFEIPETLNPDPAIIKSKFYELSRKYHPDFYTRSSENEQSDILDKAALLNKAYKIFQNKNALIKYVLTEKGLLIEEEKFELAPAFLMEVMELNEELTDAKMEDDAVKIYKVKEAIAQLQKSIYQPVQTIVEQYKPGETSTEELLKVKQYYFQKKYLDRILAAIR